MRPMRAIAIALLGALTLGLAGCGGGVGADSEAASLLKPGAVAYLELVTDPESEQWKQAEQLLQKFPDGDRWIAELKRELVQEEGLDWKRDVKPALGDRTIIAAYPNSGPASEGSEPLVVGLTNAEDPDKTVALFKKFDQEDARPTVTRVLDGWIAISDSEAALEAALKADGGQSLADDEGFKTALTELPEDALGRVYVDPAGVVSSAGSAFKLPGLDELDFAGAWTKTRDDGAELSFVVRGAGAEKLLGTGEPYASKLLEHVPGDAFAFISFRGEGLKGQLDEFRSNPLFSMGLRELEREAGVNVAEITALFDGEVAFFARPGVPTAEFTLLLESDDPPSAKSSIESLLRLVPESLGLKVETREGVVVVSTAPSPLQASGDTLGDTDRYTNALDAANAPDEYTGLAYVDLTLAGRLIGRYAGAEVNRNLEPLQTLVAYGTKDGDRASALAFLGID
jgi:hypothetical protein